MSPSMPACQGMNAIESAACQAAHAHPDAALAARREQHPAAHGEPVEERQQHRGRAHVARRSSGRPKTGPTMNTATIAATADERQQRLAAAVAPGEEQPDRDADDDRLAQCRAEVLERPVRRLLGPAAAVHGLGEVRRPVQRVQRVAGDVPVQRRPQAAARAPRARRARAAGGGPAPATARARRARRAPTPPAASAPPRRAAPAPARRACARCASSSTAPRISTRERRVLVAEQRVALEHRARQHDQRGDGADPGREELGAEPVGEPHDARRSTAASATPAACPRRSRTAWRAPRPRSRADAGSARSRPRSPA